MRIEKAIAWSLAIHLLLTGAYAVNLGIKRNSPADPPPAVFAELVPPSPDTTHRSPERLAEEREAAAAPEKPPEPSPETGVSSGAFALAGTPETPPADPGPVPDSATATASAGMAPGAVPDNTALPAAPDLAMIERARMHHMAIISTESFYRSVPGELNRVVNEALANGAFMSQGDALIHMDVTPSGQVGNAHVQANSPALYHRLERIDWRAALPSRPLAACNAIHLRISVEGNDIRVTVELL